MKRLLALAAVLAAAVSAPLASDQPLDAPKPLSRTVEKWQDMAVSELIGMVAVDRQGKQLGQVRDLILGAQTGAAHSAVVAVEGWLSLGDRLLLYPVNALAPGRSAGRVVVQLDREDLGKRTGVEELERSLREYTPGANLADRRFLPASELLGKPVNDRDGKRAGELEDIVLNLGTAELRHVVVELERAQRRIALPLHALAVPMLRGEPLRVKAPL